MGVGLLLNCDETVAIQLFTYYKVPHFKFDRCLVLIDEDKKLIGAILFHAWNGSNVELSYYGENTLTPGVIRYIARFAICTFDPSRLTVMVSKRRRRLLRSLQRFGFRLEGTQRCYYGKHDCDRDTGVRLVMFRDDIERVARLKALPGEAGTC